MPYVYDPLDNEDDQGLAQQPPMTGGGQTFSGDGSAGPSLPKDQKGVNKQGSGFVGLDQYMAANKGNKFGNQVTGKVANTVGSAQQNLNQGAQEFTNASNQGTTRWEDVGQGLKSVVDKAGKDTTQADIDQVNKLKSASYQGPQSFSGTAASNVAMGGVQKAKQEAQALQSEGGRFALLDQYFGRPSYSMGEKTLDNALVSNSKGVPAKSQALMNRTNQLGQQANETSRSLENLAAGNREASSNVAKQATDYTQKSLNDFQTDLNKRYTDFNSKNDAYNKAMRGMADQLGHGADPAAITSPGYDSNDLYKMLGVDDAPNLYGIGDVSGYFKDPEAISLSQFESPEDAARYKALGELAGNFELPVDPSLAGTAGSGHITADRDRLFQDVAQRKDAATKEYGNIVQLGRQILDKNAMLVNPQKRLADTRAQISGLLDQFQKTYGFRPEISDQMLGWLVPKSQLNYPITLPERKDPYAGLPVSIPGGRNV